MEQTRHPSQEVRGKKFLLICLFLFLSKYKSLYSKMIVLCLQAKTIENCHLILPTNAVARQQKTK